MKIIYKQVSGNQELVANNKELRYIFVYQYKGKRNWNVNEDKQIPSADGYLLIPFLTDFQLTTN